MAKIGQIIVGAIVFALNSIIVAVALSQIWKSRALFMSFQDHKYKLGARMLNFFTAAAFLLFGATSVDLWMWPVNYDEAIHTLQILLRLTIDMILISSAVIMGYTTTRSYSLLLLKKEESPLAKYVWGAVVVLETLAVIIAIAVAFATQAWEAVLFYGLFRNAITVFMSVLISLTLFFFASQAEEGNLSMEESVMAKRTKKMGIFWGFFAGMSVMAFVFQLMLHWNNSSTAQTSESVIRWGDSASGWIGLTLVWGAQWLILGTIITWVWTSSSDSGSFAAGSRNWVSSTSKYNDYEL